MAGGNRSTVEEHPDRGRIEFDMARGVPPRAIAKKYGLGLHSVYRFKRKLPPQLRAAHIGKVLKAGADLDQLRIDMGEGILQNLATQVARLLLVQDAALEAGDRNGVAYIARTIGRFQELVAKLLGELQSHHVHTTIGILVAPEYLELRAALIRALAPFPDARAAVAAALQRIERQAAQVPPRLALEASATNGGSGHAVAS